MRRSRFVGNTAALGVSTLVTAAITLLQVKVLAATLPQEGFGLFAALRGLALFLGMLAANGLPAVLVRYLPEHEARGERARAAVLAAATMALALVAAAVVLVLVDRVDVGVFRDVPDDALTPGLRLAFAATTAAVTVKFVLFGGFNGLRRLGAQTVLETGGLAAQVTWIVLARDRLGIEMLFRIMATVTTAVCAVGLPWFAWRLARDAAGERAGTDRDRARPRVDGVAPASPPGSIAPGSDAAGGDPSGTAGSSPGGATGGPASPPTASARAWLAYWGGASLLTLVAIAYSDLDRFLLSRLLLLEVLSLFHVAGRVVRLLDRFLAVPVLAFQPEVTRLDAENRRDAADAALRVFVRFNAAVAAFVGAAAGIWAADVLRLVSTRAYADGAVLVAVMATAVPLAAVTAPLTSMMRARDAIGRAVRCDAVWTTTYFGVMLLAVPWLGVLGAALAHVAARAAQLGAAVAGSTVPVRPAHVARSGLRLVAVVALAFGPVVVLRAVAGASPWTLAWVPAAAFLYRLGLRRLRLLRRRDCEVVAGVLSRRGMQRSARLVARMI